MNPVQFRSNHPDEEGQGVVLSRNRLSVRTPSGIPINHRGKDNRDAPVRHKLKEVGSSVVTDTPEAGSKSMSNPPSSSNRDNLPQMQVGKGIVESIDILKTTMEEKINRLTQANRRLKSKIFDLYTVFELSRRLNSLLDLDVLLSGMLTALGDELGVESTAVFLRRDPKQDKLSLFKLKATEPPSGATTSALEISLGGELARLLLRENDPLFLKEMLPHLKAGDSEVETLRGLNCKLCIALTSRDQLVGILSLGPKKPDQRFTDSDLEFVSVLAGQLTVAVENAVLYENQKTMNEELRSTQRQLVQSERLAAIGQLSASLAHEINNPLGIIKNYLVILSDGIDPSNPNQGNLTAIKEEVDRIARIVRGLLDFSRPAKEEMTLLDASPVLKQTLFLLSKDLLSRDINLKADLPERLPEVRGSEDQLRQVFLNLLVNARDSMPEGGELKVRAREVHRAIEIEISDTGCGISPENLSRIFDPFFTTKEQGKGTGLGLWVCSGIIERHGGVIRARRKEKGTSFVVTLPKAEPQGPAQEERRNSE
ncbi:MAG: ATP-binding protein [Candidatus Zixiibacteriota bacterium]